MEKKSIELLEAAIPNADQYDIDTTGAKELLNELYELKVGQRLYSISFAFKRYKQNIARKCLNILCAHCTFCECCIHRDLLRRCWLVASIKLAAIISTVTCIHHSPHLFLSCFTALHLSPPHISLYLSSALSPHRTSPHFTLIHHTTPHHTIISCRLFLPDPYRTSPHFSPHLCFTYPHLISPFCTSPIPHITAPYSSLLISRHHTIPYHTIPYLPSLALPYFAMPCLAFVLTDTKPNGNRTENFDFLVRAFFYIL